MWLSNTSTFSVRKKSKPRETEVKKQEKKKIRCNGIFAYLEDIPQFLLQVYILWKTPSQCFSLETDWDIIKVRTVQSIMSSFLSIAAHVVPFYEKRRNETWKLFSISGFFLHFASGVFLNVTPKLVLISWTFSILNWYGWFFVMSLILIAGLSILFLYKEESFKSKLLLTVQITFGYVGGKRGLMISALLLSCFLFPLGISLNAAKASSYVQEHNSFELFPRDPFPSRTICFTNLSLIEQHERWLERNMTFSEQCNLTYNAVPCLQQETQLIITQLWLMIGAMSAGPSIIIILILGGITAFYLVKLIESCLHKKSTRHDMNGEITMDSMYCSDFDTPNYYCMDFMVDEEADTPPDMIKHDNMIDMRFMVHEEANMITKHALVDEEADTPPLPPPSDKSLTDFLKGLFYFV